MDPSQSPINYDSISSYPDNIERDYLVFQMHEMMRTMVNSQVDMHTFMRSVLENQASFRTQLYDIRTEINLLRGEFVYYEGEQRDVSANLHRLEHQYGSLHRHHDEMHHQLEVILDRVIDPHFPTDRHPPFPVDSGSQAWEPRIALGEEGMRKHK